jgi:hypothetical protein
VRNGLVGQIRGVTDAQQSNRTAVEGGLLAYTSNTDRFFSAWATTERIRFGFG